MNKLILPLVLAATLLTGCKNNYDPALEVYPETSIEVSVGEGRLVAQDFLRTSQVCVTAYMDNRFPDSSYDKLNMMHLCNEPLMRYNSMSKGEAIRLYKAMDNDKERDYAERTIYVLGQIEKAQVVWRLEISEDKQFKNKR